MKRHFFNIHLPCKALGQLSAKIDAEEMPPVQTREAINIPSCHSHPSWLVTPTTRLSGASEQLWSPV